MGRPRVPLLSRERIRDAALSIIDRDGLSGLSMRKLAGGLGVQAASLYKHYPTKDDVLDDIARGVIGRVDTSAFNEGADWQQALASGPAPTGTPWPRIRIWCPISPRDPASARRACNSPTPYTAAWSARAGRPGGHPDRCGHPTPRPGFHGGLVLAGLRR